MADTTHRILEEVARTGIDLLLREPFYAHLLGSLNKAVVGPEHPVETLAIGMGHDSLTLFINAAFWDEVLTQPQHRYGVLKHELLHLVFWHPFVQEPMLDPTLLNVAFDLVVNQYIEREQLPDGSLFLDTFGALRLEAGQTWFYYYKKLEELRPSRGSDLPKGVRGEILRNLSLDANGLERHKPWYDIRKRSELERSVAETHLNGLLQSACRRLGDRLWGTLPGGLRETLGELTTSVPVPHLPWHHVIRLFAASAVRTYLKNTIRRPSKRYGTTPGLRIHRKRRLMVAVDTSGSVRSEELQLFFREIYHLWRLGASVEVLETDACVHRHYPYQGHLPGVISGGGGTDFNDALEMANKERPDGLVFFTDGHAEVPKVRPRIPVLWVITPDGIDAHSPTWQHLPGWRVKMKL